MRTWEQFEPVPCDLCENNAMWKHPAGGFRCDLCPRPEENPTPLAVGEELLLSPTEK